MGVTDVARARRVYQDLGRQGREVEETVFFETGGALLVLWGRDKLTLDAGVGDAGPGGPDGHVWEIAYNPGFSLAEDGSITLPDDFGKTLTLR